MSFSKKVKSFFGIKDKETTVTVALPEQKQKQKLPYFQEHKDAVRHLFKEKEEEEKRAIKKIKNKLYFRKPQLVGAIKYNCIKLIGFIGTEYHANENKNVYSSKVFKARKKYVYEYRYV